MIVKTNNGNEIKITEPNIVVKDGKLFNEKTGFYEAIEGDRVSFVTHSENGYKVSTAGTVEGYTCNGCIKLRGVKMTYQVNGGYSIEHTTRVVKTTDENTVIAEISYAD